ncbi:ERF family protein [Sporomusa malonica]|uniref:ERF superfamily protein n=1 Tax=Sporomusa malonica TaxID=112901 RepID=A0A1W2D5U7_9FIRM|nr:ERF family protein [Sporomusa malonica]SMC92428.1 ERF superfamily protein [Sporomusa malonica]
MKNIASKLIKVSRECAAVAKNGTNDFHRYTYVQANDVAKIVNQALINHGIATTVTHEVLNFSSAVNKNGKEEKVVTVKATVTFVDADSGETLTTTGLGSGQDIGDKATMKAETAALKYSYIQAFNMACSDADPEADSSVDERMGAEKQRIANASNPKIPVQNNTTSSPTQSRCSSCNDPISSKVREYSILNFNRPLCLDCQKTH